MIPPKHRFTGLTGFTLIELLVVIAIIMILASILFPVFSKVREKARQASCASNLKQLATAMNMYAQDHDERFPPSEWWINYPTTGTSWRITIFPYVKTRQTYVCPSAPELSTFDATTFTDTGNTGQYPTSGYAMPYTHSAIGGGMLPMSGPANLGRNFFGFGIHMAQVDAPAETLLLLDSAVGSWAAGEGLFNPHGYAFPTVNGSRHSGGINYAFVDGHVKWLTPDGLLCNNTKCYWSIQDPG